ncbi:hypothetical protein B0H19DRAFT_1264514 [Mycena capillaripes]|nr:hypothetical protein B0H19DRAFT_1264514 [Mycena capillaripes]
MRKGIPCVLLFTVVIPAYVVVAQFSFLVPHSGTPTATVQARVTPSRGEARMLDSLRSDPPVGTGLPDPNRQMRRQTSVPTPANLSAHPSRASTSAPASFTHEIPLPSSSTPHKSLTTDNHTYGPSTTTYISPSSSANTLANTQDSFSSGKSLLETSHSSAAAPTSTPAPFLPANSAADSFTSSATAFRAPSAEAGAVHAIRVGIGAPMAAAALIVGGFALQ